MSLSFIGRPIGLGGVLSYGYRVSIADRRACSFAEMGQAASRRPAGTWRWCNLASQSAVF